MAGVFRSIMKTKLSSYSVAAAHIRYLNLLEYQSKALLESSGVAIQKFRVVQNVEEAKQLTQHFRVDEYVIKAQVHAGGRGRGHFDNGFKSGVHITKDPAKVVEIVGKMLGHRLITKQTPKEGIFVKKVMIAESVNITRETYICILMDRGFNGPVIIASSAGGMDIESVSQETPHLIKTVPVDILIGVTDSMAESIADFLQFEGSLKAKQQAMAVESLRNPKFTAGKFTFYWYQHYKGLDSADDFIKETYYRDPASVKFYIVFHREGCKDPSPVSSLSDDTQYLNLGQATEEIKKLWKLFQSVDALQMEINPFAETDKGEVISVDAKLQFDDNAQFRQSKIFSQEDVSETDPREVEATRARLNYIPMSGNIGCLVNGAGLAMATMDIIKLHGGEPANFLDVGGGVQEDQVLKAFQILTSDPNVKAILVNVFGGIVNCATIANGIINASHSLKLNIPLIVRLEGTNVDEAKKILSTSGLDIVSASDLEEAAQKAVACLMG